MPYDPFARGPRPVGVTTYALADPARDRPLPTEVWYPAAEGARGRDLDPATQDCFEVLPGFPPGRQAAGRDLAPATGTAPLVIFSHGHGGHRRQTTHLCTHLASHGYVVAAPDHTGGTVADLMQRVLERTRAQSEPEIDDMLRPMAAARPADASFVVDRLLEEAPLAIDPRRIGMAGHSFGGWTTLMTTARDRRIRAALPLAPAGGPTPLATTVLEDALVWEWGRDVPTLFLVADRDTLLPLDGMEVLLARTPGTKRMVVLERADHMHFCDEVETTHELFRSMPPPGLGELAAGVPPASALAPGAHAYQLIQGLGLAHFDRALRGHEGAAALLDADLVALFAARGVAVQVR